MNHIFSEIIQFLGRLHPMLVHLPIGFLVLLAALEALGLFPKFKHVTAASRIIVALAIPATVFSAAFGWLLAWNGDYDTQLLFLHRWTGTSLAPVVILLWWLHWRNWPGAYRACLAVTVILLAVAGHFGASLTHGSDYLFPWKSLTQNGTLGGATSQFTYAELMTQPVYSAVVQPVLTKYCVACHGPNKSKGDLKLDTAENLFKGGKDGESVLPGDAANSDLIKRILLPADADDHMPPPGKRQPDYNDLALLQWWIDAGAQTDKTVAELQPPENIVRILQSKGKPAPK
ncbi:MAG TPA: c-type cytochrome domain-containing protein [Verrucomicrobiae bacterium]